jgi:hypothetical protein
MSSALKFTIKFTTKFWPRCAAAVALAGVIAAGARAEDAQGRRALAINWIAETPASNHVVVKVSGLSARELEQLAKAHWPATNWQQLFSVYVEQGDPLRDAWLPPMLGSYRVEKAEVSFEPQFPLQAGLQYRAIFRPDRVPGAQANTAAITSLFRLPARDRTSSTVVSAVYPTADVVPENLLKFYLHFSASMSRGRIYEHIHLYAENGAEVELPFLEIDEELWDSSMTRLTLFIDPGRIKRGVAPLEEIGPALEAGKRFTLVIDKTWQDAAGNRLKKEFRKSFSVAAPDREPPDPERWAIAPPPVGTREPVSVEFGEPMDHALARRLIRILDSAKQTVAGESSLVDHEHRWTFVPARSWTAGTYQLSVQTTIEDLAGNNIGKPFEVDLFEGVQRRLTNTVVNRPFEIR